AAATHDTASAVAGMPLERDWAYISSGTWSLVGVERDEVLIDERVARHNFTNEGGAFGATRFLKNVMGLWILESCRREWMSMGLATDWEHLLSLAEQAAGHRTVIFPDDPSFFNPSSMLEAIKKHLASTQQSSGSDPGSIGRTVLDSLAFRYA